MLPGHEEPDGPRFSVSYILSKSFVRKYPDSSRIGRLQYAEKNRLSSKRKARQVFSEGLPRPYGGCRASIISVRRLAVCRLRRPGSRPERFRNPSYLSGLRPTQHGRVGSYWTAISLYDPPRTSKLRCWSLGCFALRRATLLRTARPFFQTVTPLILISRTPCFGAPITPRDPAGS